jgi:hypothetical protein
MGPETEPFTHQRNRKHDIIDGQTIGRNTQELKKNTYMNNTDSIKTWIQS